MLNGHPGQRLPNTENVSFLGWTGAELLAQLRGIAASTGATCHAATPSCVLEAMVQSAEAARGAIRLSIGRFTNESEIDRAATC